MILARATLLVTAAFATLLATPESSSAQSKSEETSSIAYDGLALDTAGLRRDVDLLKRALEHIHPGLVRYSSRQTIDRAFRRLDARLSDDTTELAFYRAVSVACAVIRCGHTRVMAPRIDRFREKHTTQLPFTFRILDKSMIVDAVARGVPLRRGDEVLQIEGRKVSTLLQEIGATVCLDGFTDSVRNSRLDTAYEFADSGFDHYLPAWIGFRRSFRLGIVRGGEKSRVTVRAVNRAAWRALTPSARDFADATSVRELDDDTALLTVGSFVNYRKPIDATARYSEFFQKIRAFGCEHLIVDLRNNGGGSTDASEPLARFLVERLDQRALPPIVKNYRCPEELRKHLSTWVKGVWQRPAHLFRAVEGGYEVATGKTAPWKPHADRFRGRVTVLTSPYNASGSTMLIAALEKAGVRLVGETTGGAPRGPTAGLLFTLTLPHSKLRIHIPAMLQRTGLNDRPDGQGVEPHVLIRITRAEFLARRDRTLEAARTR